MRERIRELLSQAGVHYEVMPKDTVYEKFAESIVRECISQIDAQCFPTHSHELVQKGAWNAYLRTAIKQHFGVES